MFPWRQKGTGEHLTSLFIKKKERSFSRNQFNPLIPFNDSILNRNSKRSKLCVQVVWVYTHGQRQVFMHLSKYSGHLNPSQLLILSLATSTILSFWRGQLSFKTDKHVRFSKVFNSHRLATDSVSESSVNFFMLPCAWDYTAEILRVR